MSKPNSNFVRKFLLGAVGTLLIYLPVQESLAQLEEIVVTSRRYEESITDAPVAVAVMDMDFLEDQKVDSIQDIKALSISMTIETRKPSGGRIVIDSESGSYRQTRITLELDR